MKSSSSQPEAASEDLVLYPGILVSFRVPPRCDTALLDQAIAKIAREIEESIGRHLPPDCAGSLQKMA
jgi:hypothetical protein